MKLSQKLVALASTAMLLTNVLSSGIAGATSASGTLAVGSLGSQSLPGAISLSGTVSTAYSATGLTGSLTGISISDNRGSAAGWVAQSRVDQNFNLDGASVKKYISGSGTATISGEYSGATCQGTWTATGVVPCGAIVLKVTNASAGVPTEVSVWDPTTAFPGAPTVTAQAVAAGAYTPTGSGLTVTFAGTWAINDYIRMSVDYFPVSTYFTGTASTLAAGSGFSDYGMTTPTSGGTAYTISTYRTDVNAPSGTGAGTYTYNLALAQPVHGNAIQGSYNSAMTFNLQ